MDTTDIAVMTEAATGGGVTLSVSEFKAMAASAEATYDAFLKLASGMTDRAADFVRRARVEKHFSWRAVARAFHDRKGGLWIVPASNQLAGIALCQVAAERLGENPWREPWN